MDNVVTAVVSQHPAFRLVRTHPLSSLGVEAQEYVHVKTGARHLHLAAANDENVFLVALRTFPMDSTGVAHILEHTALCGSERFPVRDPFFLMIRRSLNTFMNAFTSSDWTAYPFASKNRKDFENLLQVYMDAVFFANLDPMDFAQEGHRLEFSRADDPSSPLEYKGVVYNEMKGAMSSPVQALWHTLSKHLFPTTTYHYNSGGDPDEITSLSYEGLKRFYRRHYHPSNALFFTYGDIPAEEHHARFEALALERFDAQHLSLPIRDEIRQYAPIEVTERYAVAAAEGEAENTHIVMGWLLGHGFDLEANLEAHVLSSVLMENSASPLQMALEKTELGSAPSPISGLEDSNREMTFVCGIEGSEPDQAKNLEALVMSVLENVARDGVPMERLEAIVHQIELHQREISGDHYPFGLQLALAALPPMVHGGDPLAPLDLDPVLALLREKIRQPGYVQGLVRRLLIDNPHRVTLVLAPDTGLAARRDEATKAKLDAVRQALSAVQAKAIVDQAAALAERQNSKNDESILPKVGLQDVPLSLPVPTFRTAKDLPLSLCEKGTNGLVYHQVLLPLGALDASEHDILSLHSATLAELGCGNKTYLEVQDWQSAVSGGVACYPSLRSAISDEQSTQGYVVVSGKALARNQSALAELMASMTQSARFDETDRLRELISQMRARREQSVTGNGHGYAMGAASRGMSPLSALSFQMGGLGAIRDIKRLDDSLGQASNASALAERLHTLHKKIISGSPTLLAVGDATTLAESEKVLSAHWRANSSATDSVVSLPSLRQRVQEAWITNTQVNFCAKAYPTVPIEHPDAAALTVLGVFLKNGYLHRAIREQGGAYGGGASQESGSACFRFYSYRDPRFADTLSDFDRSLAWLASDTHSGESLEQAILGVVGQIDKPKSPAGDAKSAFHSTLFGRTPEQRRRFRERILNVRLADLSHAADTWLRPELASVAVVTFEGNRSVAEQLGLAIEVL